MIMGGRRVTATGPRMSLTAVHNDAIQLLVQIMVPSFNQDVMKYIPAESYQQITHFFFNVWMDF